MEIQQLESQLGHPLPDCIARPRLRTVAALPPLARRLLLVMMEGSEKSKAVQVTLPDVTWWLEGRRYCDRGSARQRSHLRKANDNSQQQPAV
jgi:hypothetical protein